MKAVIIEEARFNELFDNAAKTLELEKFRVDSKTSTEDMHRRFHFVLFTLKDQLRDSG